MSKKFNDPWVRNITVSDTVRHKKGYTLYKITSKVFPKNSIEATSEVTVWKRYNDFKKLHKALYTIHQTLYLKDTFPSFAKARLFGRFEESVIEERRLSALNLLQFAAKHPPLFTNQIFVKFFESGYIVEDVENTVPETKLPDDILQPHKLYQSDISHSSHSNSGDESLSKENKQLDNALGGTWQHPQVPDSISLGSNRSENDDDDNTTFTDDDSTIPNFLEYDPLFETVSNFMQEDKSVLNQDDLCNSWLLSAMQACSHPNVEKEIETNLEFPKPFGDLESTDDIVNFVGEQCFKAKDVLSTKSSNHFVFDVPVSPATEAFAELKEFDPLSNENEICIDSESDNIYNYDQFAMTPNEDKHKSHCRPSYIVNAAECVRFAQEAEANEHYIEAFELYKRAIDILLQGSQKENSPDLKDAVRKKVLLYLMRAEEIYENQLPKVNDTRKVKSNMSLLTYPPENKIMGLRGCVQDLKKFKVLGVLGRTLLVLDVSDSSTYVVKTLYKSSRSTSVRGPNVVPESIPFMVKLYKVYETSYALFLIVEHASGGRLWEYVSSYLQGNSQNESSQVFLHSNVYSGKKVTPTKETLKDPCCQGDVGHRNEKEETSELQQKTRNRLSSSTGSIETALSQKCLFEAFNGMDDIIPTSSLHLPESCILPWAAEMVIALESLHKLGLSWMDLQPDNILLGTEGHILLTYHSHWNCVDHVIRESGKENFYCAPEVGNVFPVMPDCDWWSFGVILYELITGRPLALCHPTGITAHTVLTFPSDASLEAKDLLNKLIQYNPSERLGSGIYGVEEIKSHPFFRTICWHTLQDS